MKYLTLILATLISFAASAAATHKCGRLDSIGNLIGQTKSFANGGVVVAYVSTEEPAAAPDHLLVFVSDNEMGHSCTAISLDADGDGFGYVSMETLKGVSYDAKRGVLFSVQVGLPDFSGDGQAKTQVLNIRANQATGKVTLE